MPMETRRLLHDFLLREVHFSFVRTCSFPSPFYSSLSYYPGRLKGGEEQCTHTHTHIHTGTHLEFSRIFPRDGQSSVVDLYSRNSPRMKWKSERESVEHNFHNFLGLFKNTTFSSKKKKQLYYTGNYGAWRDLPTFIKKKKKKRKKIHRTRIYKE